VQDAASGSVHCTSCVRAAANSLRSIAYALIRLLALQPQTANEITGVMTRSLWDLT
jgi:hypothetical protein